jgi:hypothetical protein
MYKTVQDLQKSIKFIHSFDVEGHGWIPLYWTSGDRLRVKDGFKWLRIMSNEEIRTLVLAVLELRVVLSSEVSYTDPFYSYDMFMCVHVR